MSTNNAIPRMLGIKAIAEMYSLSPHFVRTLVNNGKVVAIREGSKILVNADKFCDYLNTNCIQPANEEVVEDIVAKPRAKTAKPRIAPIPAGWGR